jgi:glycosyltransferase involved in cell wall biosynthesis
MHHQQPLPITIFTPSFADEGNTNAQNLTVKEIVSRLPPDLFRIIMVCSHNPDPRIAQRKNTKLFPFHRHGNAAHWLVRSWLYRPNIYFYPRFGPLDRAWLALQGSFPWRTSLVTHVVYSMTNVDENDLAARSIRRADAVFANSTYVAETVRQRFGRDVATIYDGVDRRFFFPPPEREPRSPLIVLYAGSFQARKRPEIVIGQAARFPHVRFHLAGEGECETACRDLAARLGCRNVSFCGHLSQRGLGEEMRRADIFLFPSIGEGHPQVLGQAAACGLPVIAMNCYRPEYVVNGRTGFLLDSDEEIAPKLEILVRDSGLRRSMAAAAIEHSRKFDWDRIAEQWIDVFMQVSRRGAS